MSSLNLADAKQLCTASELRLVTTSMGSRLKSFDSAGLKKNIVEARKLRDKWRDQATAQRRETQRAQGSRTSDKNARTQQKAQLFDETLARFTQRLSQVEASPAIASAPAKKAKAAPTKRQRAQEHRESRANVRDVLREKKQMLNDSKPAAAKPKKSAKKPAAAAAAPAKAAPKKKKAPQKTAPPQPPKTSVKLTDAPPANPAQNRAAKTAAKQARLNASGLNSRARGHLSAQTRRQQGKRDNRG